MVRWRLALLLVLFASAAARAQVANCPADVQSMPAGYVCGNPGVSMQADYPQMMPLTAWTQGIVGVLKSANMNSTLDQPLVMAAPGAYQVTAVNVTNCGSSPSGAAGGLYTAASKGGTAIVAAGQTYTALTSSAAIQALTLASGVGATKQTATQLYFSLTTPLGSADTCDVYVLGIGTP